jgi:phosphonate metabolism-associated iron-containing alcohol dehydrogenase
MELMFKYYNPSNIIFETGLLDNSKRLSDLIGKGDEYCIFTYGDNIFKEYCNKITKAIGEPKLIIDNILPNPDYANLKSISKDFSKECKSIKKVIALGGGSVIDTAKFIVLGKGDFDKTVQYLEKKNDFIDPTDIDLISIPTTAGTGSELTCWATIWDEKNQRKHSLIHPTLFSKLSLFDSNLTLSLPKKITIETSLDAMSHAFESIWNINSNPISNIHAISAIKIIMSSLPNLLEDLENVKLREEIMKASMYAGLAFSNTKTAISHSISYPITLKYKVPHGIACSFTLPIILKSVQGLDEVCDKNFKLLFSDFNGAPEKLIEFFSKINVSTNFKDYIGNANDWQMIVKDAFAGERGKNFIGNYQKVLQAQDSLGY